MSSAESPFQFFLKNCIAGTAGGIAITLVGHPFDTLKVRLQTQSASKPIYNGVVDCFLKTIKWEGVGGLYKGVASPLVGQMFFRACLFSSNRQLQCLIGGPDATSRRLSVKEYFVVGAGTGFCVSFIECPIDLFKTKMQIQIIQSRANPELPLLYKNVFHAAATIVKERGIRGAYQGLLATHLRNIPAFSCYFGFYEFSRNFFTPQNGTVADLKFWQQFAAGGAGGIAYWLLTYPLDVIKSTMQSDDANPAKRKCKNVSWCVQHLYKNEGGIKRFFRGFIPCMLRAIPANGAMLLTFENVRLLLS